MKQYIKVLVVEDSPVKKKILEHILTSDKNIKVIGFAKNSEQALDFIKHNSPDIITMDINIEGGLNGFELTKLILNKKPIPVVIISAIRSDKNKAEIADAMMKSGALYFIDSPPGPWHESFDKSSKEIIKYVKLLSNIKIIQKQSNIDFPIKVTANRSKSKIVAIGVSTGGPAILKQILSQLPAKINLPIIVAQHISPGFDKLLVEQLKKFCKAPIKIITNHEKAKPGTIYFAPAGMITELIEDEFAIIDPPKGYMSHLPSISALFASMVSYYGKNTIAIILSGMGRDGVKELKILKEEGAITIAQDKETSVVYGMPKEAAETGAAKYVYTPDEIAEFLNKNL